MFGIVTQALPLLESGSVTQVMDPRLGDNNNDDDSRVVRCMARAALLCLKNDSGRSFSISEVRFWFSVIIFAHNNSTN